MPFSKAHKKDCTKKQHVNDDQQELWIESQVKGPNSLWVETVFYV